MGIDFSLSENHPSVIINGRKYHYGRTPDANEYLVENAHYAKDYWVFKEKEDLQAFLVNLPESADRDLKLKLHPDWRDVTPEQRDAYMEQDKQAFRAMAAEKVENGTAQTFNIDLEGKHGPYEPQRIETRSTEPPLERVERQFLEWKAAYAPPERDPSLPAGTLGDAIHGLMDHSWQSGLSEAGKLRVLEGDLDWTGVSDREKETVLAREVDFTKITREQLNFVYEDIADDLVDERPARRLFDTANYERAIANLDKAGDFTEQMANVRDTTRNLVESVLMDQWPRTGVIIEFGLDSQSHYEALYYPIRNEELAPAVLDAAMGHGAKLTEMARGAPSNPHKDIEFHTSWDMLLGREKAEASVRGGGESENGTGKPGTQKSYDPTELSRGQASPAKGKDTPVR